MYPVIIRSVPYTKNLLKIISVTVLSTSAALHSNLVSCPDPTQFTQGEMVGCQSFVQEGRTMGHPLQRSLVPRPWGGHPYIWRTTVRHDIESCLHPGHSHNCLTRETRPGYEATSSADQALSIASCNSRHAPRAVDPPPPVPPPMSHPFR